MPKSKEKSEIAPEPFGLIVGEDPATEHALDARHWVNVYQELLAFHSDLLQRMTGALEAMPESARRGVEAGDLATMRAHIQHARERLDFWDQRSMQLAGVDFDLATRRLRHRGREVRLTRRESQLLDLLLRHPGREFNTAAIAAMAWQDRRLSSEQVRTYIVRVREKLAQVALPAELRTHPRRGYALLFD